VTAEPFVSSVELQRNDIIVVMASDGLWDVISDDEAIGMATTRTKIGSSNSGSGGSMWRPTEAGAKEASDFLLSTALARGSQDNITVITIALQWD